MLDHRGNNGTNNRQLSDSVDNRPSDRSDNRKVLHNFDHRRGHTANYACERLRDVSYNVGYGCGNGFHGLDDGVSHLGDFAQGLFNRLKQATDKAGARLG
ncbi:hypothetical protein GCM10027403_14310 [Arthrobacter tecti]